jgi:ABC-type nitrate/sulfonate/bicarbonate transport system substrate-binding protein
MSMATTTFPGSGRLTLINGSGPAERALHALARSQGFFERMGLEVAYNNQPDGQKALAELLAGRGDVCMQIGFGPCLPAIEQGHDLRVLAGANLRAVHVVFARPPDIRRVRDLEGRTVGIGSLGALTHQLMTAVLRKHGADPSKVRFVCIGNSAAVFQAVVAGEVDAGLGEIDNYAQQAQLGIHSLPDGDLWNELAAFTNQASYTLRDTILKKRDLLVRALAASAALYRFVCSPESREAYFAAYRTAMPHAEPIEAESAWNFYQERKPFATHLVLDEARIRYMQELNIAMGLQSRILPFDEVADMSLAREALALLEG